MIIKIVYFKLWAIVIQKIIYYVWIIKYVMLNLFKYAYYLTMNNFLWLTALIIIKCSSITVDPYTEVGNSISGSATLYSNTTALSQGPPAIQFSVSYPFPRQSNAQLVIGMVGYEQRDNMANSYFKLSVGVNTLTHFSIYLLTSGSTQLNLAKIMYIALEDINNAFFCLWIQFPSFSNISTGSGTRVDNKFSSFYQITGGSMLNSNLTLNRVYSFLTGFQIQATNGNFGVEIAVSITNQISFTTTIKAQFDCLIQYVQGMLFFIDTGKFTDIKLFTYQNTLTADSSPQSFTLSYVTSFGNRIYGMFHIKGTGTRSSNPIIRFNLEIDNTSTPTIDFTTIQKVQYTYVFIGAMQCKTQYPFYTNSLRTSCTDQCSSSMTQSPNSSVCTLCTSPCSQCVGVQTQCTACVSGYQLNGSACLQVRTVVQDVQTNTTASSGSMLYLLGLLGVIPISILVIYLCRRSSKVKQQFNKSEFIAQPSINLS